MHNKQKLIFQEYRKQEELAAESKLDLRKEKSLLTLNYKHV